MHPTKNYPSRSDFAVDGLWTSDKFGNFSWQDDQNQFGAPEGRVDLQLGYGDLATGGVDEEGQRGKDFFWW